MAITLMDLVKGASGDTGTQDMQKEAAQKSFQQNRAAMYKIGQQMAIRDIKKIAEEEAGIAPEEEMTPEEAEAMEKAKILAEMEADPAKAEEYAQMASE